MINKLIIDDKQVELTGSSTPYYHTFSEASVHKVRYGLDNTEEVCAYAFSGCKNLTYISLPPRITMIKREAFKGCESLPTITLGEHIKYIGKGAFDGCKKLETIVFEGDAPENIAMYATLPGNTICFVPNGSKYGVVEKYEDIDISGDIKYYSRTPWNQYQQIYDITEYEDNYGEDLAHTAYINRWDNIADGSRIKEVKDRIEITGLKLTSLQSQNYVNMDQNTQVFFTYEIMPNIATNKNLTTFVSNPIISVDLDTGEPGRGKIVASQLSEGVNFTNSVITVYSESGQNASLEVTISRPTSSTEDNG